MTAPTPPEAADVRTWLGVTESAVPDDVMTEIIEAELTIQTRVCAFPDSGIYPAPLMRALYRRVGREISARQIPLGTSGDAEFGGIRLPGYDAEIARLEASYRIPVVS
ncbi:hypothetical protein ACIRJS_16590 [Streptomyces sp. NPDC102340]|uniref:hypothetical protein n=1 Tax=unclassified Streptomyces TaxID=2593676 RepID=UPI00381FA918